MNETFWRDRSSGRIHIAVKRAGRLLTDEADNLDSAGERDEITADELASADADSLCRRCFPATEEEES